MSLLDGFLSLNRKVNTVSGEKQEQEEGVQGEKISPLSLEMSDEQLIVLKNKWTKAWDETEAKKELDLKQKENEKYWLGEHYSKAQKKTGIRDQVDNLIFEALETFLPVATRQIAQPVVMTSKNPEAEKLARKVSDRIVEIADIVRLRLKIKKSVRHWALYYLGCIKLGWNMELDEIAVQTVRPQQLILDPEAITDECEYDGEYIGHYRKDTVQGLMDRFSAKASFIKEEVGKENLGTKVKYIEWWTADYLFWTLNNEVLGKAKNPHWNYDRDVPVQVGFDELGMPITGTQKIPGVNHFSKRHIPFAFLSVFNLGKNPFDDTNLIEQALPQQDMINKRVRQIDKNADNTNGGVVVTDPFTKEQVRQVANALRHGDAVYVPGGDVNRAYKRDVAPPLPNFVYQHLQDSRQELRGIFGTTGLSAQGIKSEETVRGKILVKGQDTDRAALIVDHIEQFYDYIFNWIVQLMIVYYDSPRQVSRSQGTETIFSEEMIYPLMVSVKEGSLIPKDRLTLRNEAIDLWTAQAIDPLTLAERLEEPDPQEFVRRLIMWRTNPVALLQGQSQGFQQLQTTEAGEMGVAPEQANQPLLQQVPIS